MHNGVDTVRLSQDHYEYSPDIGRRHHCQRTIHADNNMVIDWSGLVAHVEQAIYDLDSGLQMYVVIPMSGMMQRAPRRAAV